MSDEQLEQLLARAYEEGAQDAIAWNNSLGREPEPSWIDSLTRVEFLHACKEVNSDNLMLKAANIKLREKLEKLEKRNG